MTLIEAAPSLSYMMYRFIYRLSRDSRPESTINRDISFYNMDFTLLEHNSIVHLFALRVVLL